MGGGIRDGPRRTVLGDVSNAAGGGGGDDSILHSKPVQQSL